jgi:hypothetical protein
VKFDIMQEQIEIYNAILKQAKQGQDALFKKNSIK